MRRLAAVLCVFSCACTASRSASHQPPPPLAAAPPAAQGPVAPGFSPTEVAWAPIDYERAAAALETRSSSASPELPRFGQALFARMVAAANLDPVDDESQPAHVRAQIGAAYLIPLGRIMMAYGRQALSYPAENAELMVFAFSLGSRVLVLMSRVVDDIDRDANPERVREPVRAGYVEVRDGVTKIASAALGVLHPLIARSAQDRLRYADSVAHDMQAVLPRLTAEQRDSLSKQIAGMAAREKDGTILERFRRMAGESH